MTRYSVPSSTRGSPGANTSQPTGRGLGTVLFVILNFNGIADTLVCLDSLTGQTCQDFAVLVIDNGSRADDLGDIGLRFPAVELIALQENLGWAGGNNVGLRLAVDRGFAYVCLLNNDTILAPTMLEQMLAAATCIGEPCLLHPAIAFFDDPMLWQLYPDRPYVLDAAAPQLRDQHEIFNMNYAYGACLLVPVSVVQDVGLFDERLFLQFEENDFYERAIKLGIRSYCARRARMLHRESASFGGRITATKVYYQVRNRFLLAEKHTPSVRGFLRAGRAVLWTLHQQAHAEAGVTGWPGLFRWLLSADPLARAARQGARDYVRRRFGRRPPPRSAPP